MYMIAIAAIVLAAPFAAAWYFRRAASRLRLADAVWGSLEYHANQLLQDKTVPVVVGDFVEFVVCRAGDGMMTRTFLAGLMSRPRADRDTALAQAMHALSRGQDQQFNRFVIDALLYDSLRTAVSGFIVRRALYWLVTTAKDEKLPVNDAQAYPIARAANKAYGRACAA
ncbi:hypothetical protein [Novosphingobium sp. RL4]|uniref:hypothetical protein n=1 Tax=Novosphingobium sp. RL4 TaxID=3109595 RepID=UPI002D76A3E6|nr:hypothetical protein [Novosphingobium sp. RL4]WRT91373.1 hypothetical protein U9J33_09025 [Novosphingobium sp. RL4]